MIVIKHKGTFAKTESFFKKASNLDIRKVLEKYAAEGVTALSSATPIDSGKTANSWGYEISSNGSSYSICWTNSNIENGVQIAILLQYGHGTSSGAYVQGRDYINPALQPVFDKLSEEAWREVTNL